MKFAIIITSFNQSTYLKEAILSVFNQIYIKHFQLIIVDDSVEYIIRLDGDDQLLPNALVDLEEFLNEHDNRKLGFVYSNLKIMGSEKIRIYPEWKDGSIKSLENIGHLQAIKKSVADEIGHFDISLKYGHDTDQIIRIIEKGYQIKHIDKVLYYNRHHSEQYT